MTYNMWSPKDRIKGQELFPDEIEDAEEAIICRSQFRAFPEEYMAFLTGKEIPKKRSLGKLLDDQGVAVDFNSLNVFRMMLGFLLYSRTSPQRPP